MDEESAATHEITTVEQFHDLKDEFSDVKRKLEDIKRSLRYNEWIHFGIVLAMLMIIAFILLLGIFLIDKLSNL